MDQNNIDKQYQSLLQDILDNGIEKKDRTGTGTISVFGRQIRHKMSDGFPLLTTKKMAWKTMVTELLWFLRGDTNIKYLVDNDCNIWNGDAYKNFLKYTSQVIPFTKDEFIHHIKTNDGFAKLWGELGPVYGKQWRSWEYWKNYPNGSYTGVRGEIDQIATLINDLKTNPDSRRLMVNAWNVGELDQMVLPPCHYGFQVYTRELSLNERGEVFKKTYPDKSVSDFAPGGMEVQSLSHQLTTRYNNANIPTRAISLMWNQRSVDTFLGLPFNIASYGLLLEIIAKAVNMVPDELIGNLGDTHLYLNHIEQAKEQIGRDYTLEERLNMVSEEIQNEFSSGIVNLPNFPNTPVWSDDGKMSCLDDFGVPRRTREPYPLPTLNIKLHFKNEPSFTPEYWLTDDFELENYQSHPTIKAPLSN